jgi:hypothetical protein
MVASMVLMVNHHTLGERFAAFRQTHLLCENERERERKRKREKEK